MSNAVVLLIVSLFVQGLTTMTWWAGGVLLGLSRRAARYWMFASIANGMALTLTPLNSLIQIPAYLLMSNALAVVGLISLRRGLQNFLKLPRTDNIHNFAGVGVCLLIFGICWPLGWLDAGAALSAAVMVFLLLKTIHDNHTPISREFSPGVALTHSLLLASASVIFTAMACIASVPFVQHFWVTQHTELIDSVVLVFLMMLSSLITFVNGYMVVMRLVKKLQHLSHHDSLTGLLNRRAFEYLLDRECQRLQRFGEQFSLLILDIDHFKRINDRLGHAAGDAVLTAIAQTLQNHAREVDRVARFGGEEFCVLLPRTTDEGAIQAAERLRAAIHATTIAWHDEMITVTISTGLATALEPGESLEDLLRRADLALYQAKSEGRNRVVMAPAFTASST